MIDFTYVAKEGVMFGFDAQHTHNNPYEYILSPSNASKLVDDWVSSATDQQLKGEPALANSVAYVGSADGMLYAIDARTGKTRWVSAPTGQPIYDTPAVVNGLVYVGSEDGKLYAFEASTGKLHWVSDLHEGKIDFSPTVVNGVIYVGPEQGKRVIGQDFVVLCLKRGRPHRFQCGSSRRRCLCEYDG